MKNTYLAVIVVLLCSFEVLAQVTTDPALAIENEALTIYYDATKGTSGLAGASKVYMHSGVVLSSSTGTDWSNVVGDWGEDNGVGEMTKVEGELNLWKLTIPSVRAYFDVPESQEIYRIGMVFRNADGSKEGKSDSNHDIFVQVYDGFSVNIESPLGSSLFVEENQTIDYRAQSTEECNLSAVLDGEVINEVQNSTLIEGSFTITGSGKKVFKVLAVAAEQEAEDSVDLIFKSASTFNPLPSGVSFGINKHDDNSVTLVLQAPEKSSAYVVGDFSDWRVDPAFKMFVDGETFWLKIENLDPDLDYAFYYLVDEEIKIADPYSYRILDAQHDKEIIELQKYPDLRPFPSEAGTERLTSFKIMEDEYQWQVNDFQKPEKEKLIVYELLVRDFSDERTFQAVIDKLSYLKELGINALELMPVKNFEGNLSWGYNPAFYFAPDKFYGPANDLKRLVDECHKNGIAVILDMVFNHSFSQSPLLQLYFDKSAYKPLNNPWYLEEHIFTNPGMQFGYAFDHSSPYFRAFMDSANHYWIKEFRIDGFRFDLTKGFTTNLKGDDDPWGSKYDVDRINNLKRMAEKIWEVDPDTYVILEHLAENSEEKELANNGMMLWGNMNHNYSEGAMGYNDEDKSSFNWISYQERDFNEPNLVGYMESHDEERMMCRILNYGTSLNDYDTKDLATALERVKLAAAFFIPVPGPKMIWQFGELGYDVSIDEGGRLGVKPALWEYYHNEERKKLFNVFAALNQLKVEHPVFSTENFTLDTSGEFKSIQLSNEDMSVNIVGNFTTRSRQITVPFPSKGDWWDYFSGGKLSISGTSRSMLFEPGQFHIFINKEVVYEGENPTDFKIEEELTTSVNEKDIRNIFIVYPNPANKVLHIKLISDEAIIANPEISIIDMQGKVVKSHGFKNSSLQDYIMDVSNIPSGFYFLEMASGKERVIKKVIIH